MERDSNSLVNEVLRHSLALCRPEKLLIVMIPAIRENRKDWVTRQRFKKLQSTAQDVISPRACIATLRKSQTTDEGTYNDTDNSTQRMRYMRTLTCEYNLKSDTVREKAGNEVAKSSIKL
ncbi:hypothetical protein AO1008_00733 [Aspergillus oryzae 100-8]|uniref:Uncharacterized protein n=1 Tax=Aspergillus oryzae (strain 3.042) TaxID=1160506 RepID=I8I9N5_ASPO3|nr:hypothetical protein Ao3042_10103 [Aspergillus oryzae 3.042]KDE86047.1 hypothetical protein AO1008_00733 [Aspergillus oryzae 100-8]|eukprot:EIT73936.1 hypothetical protein Ao3042_10103 [Aspergillus oryzae 3.042]